MSDGGWSSFRRRHAPSPDHLDPEIRNSWMTAWAPVGTPMLDLGEASKRLTRFGLRIVDREEGRVGDERWGAWLGVELESEALRLTLVLHEGGATVPHPHRGAEELSSETCAAAERAPWGLALALPLVDSAPHRDAQAGAGARRRFRLQLELLAALVPGAVLVLDEGAGRWWSGEWLRAVTRRSRSVGTRWLFGVSANPQANGACWMRTRGMARLGVLEFTIPNVPPRHVNEMGDLLEQLALNAVDGGVPPFGQRFFLGRGLSLAWAPPASRPNGVDAVVGEDEPLSAEVFVPRERRFGLFGLGRESPTVHAAEIGAGTQRWLLTEREEAVIRAAARTHRALLERAFARGWTVMVESRPDPEGDFEWTELETPTADLDEMTNWQVIGPERAWLAPEAVLLELRLDAT